MRRSLPSIGAAVFLLLLCTDLQAASPERRPFGLERRTPWTTSNVKGSPDPPAPYRIQRAFSRLKFYEPLELVAAPGTDRLFVAERTGKIFSFVNAPKTAESELLLDVKKTVYGLAFHPQFEQNGYFYVTSIVDASEGNERGTRVSRFKTGDGDLLHGDPATEQPLIEWPSGGHNGGSLVFGPDGCLYIVTGDGSGIADQRETGQDVSDLLAAILRIDVDHPAHGLAVRHPCG